MWKARERRADERIARVLWMISAAWFKNGRRRKIEDFMPGSKSEKDELIEESRKYLGSGKAQDPETQDAILEKLLGPLIVNPQQQE